MTLATHRHHLERYMTFYYQIIPRVYSEDNKLIITTDTEEEEEEDTEEGHMA